MHVPPAKFAVWSILFFLFPLALALRLGLYALSALLTGVILCSFLSHLTRTEAALMLDTAFAWALMLFQLYLCALGHFSFPAFAGVLLFVPIAVTFYFRRKRGVYDLDHGLWHLCSALISVFAQLTYLSGALR